MIGKKIGVYMREKGYNLSEVCRDCEMDYQSIYKSLYTDRERDLRAVELLKLCAYLGIDPVEFYKKEVLYDHSDDRRQKSQKGRH